MRVSELWEREREKEKENSNGDKEGDKKKDRRGLDIFAADDDMFSENYSNVSTLLLFYLLCGM